MTKDRYKAADGGRITVLHGGVYVEQYHGSREEPKTEPRKGIKVLFVGASPFDIGLERLRADREFRAISAVAQPGRLTVANRTAATVDDIAAVLDERPDVLHLSCHSKGDTLLFEDPHGEPHPVPVDSLVARIRAYREFGGLTLGGLVLSACRSDHFADRFAGIVDTVVAWRGDLDDECAILFAKALYRAMGRDSAPALGDAARMAVVEVPDSDSHCRSLADQLMVVPV